MLGGTVEAFDGANELGLGGCVVDVLEDGPCEI